MLKRIFWLALVGVGAWMLYRLWQQRQEDFGGTTPLLAPLEPYGRHIPPPVAKPPSHADMPTPPAASSPPTRDVSPPTAPTEPQDAAAEAIVGYCARCKSRRTISDAREETTESGRRAARGICPVCGAKMFTFLPNKS